MPGSALEWLAFSARLERALESLALAACVVCLTAWALRRQRLCSAPASRNGGSVYAECVVLAAIVLAGATLRLLFISSARQAHWFFPQSTVSAVPYRLERQGLWASIWQLSDNTQVIWSQDSPILFIVHWIFHCLLGDSFELAGYVGAAWGTLGIVLAWLTGRAIVSREFGLAFAAGIAVSPLQVTWARLGGLYIASVAHTLLVIWVAFVAGRSCSLWWSAGAGALAFTSLYHYFAARVAIPLAAVAMLSGLSRRRGERRMRACLAPALAAFVFVALFITVVLQHGTFGTLWPRYMGYIGTAGEQNTLEIVEGAYANASREFATTLRRYFWESRDTARRTGPSGAPLEGATARTAGAQHGGLGLLPLAVLGAAGFLYCLLHPARGHLWLALTLGGLLLPLLSLPAARRYLIFDLGWCAFAAFGMTKIWSSPPVRSLNAGCRATIAVAGLVLTGAWSGLVIGLLNATLPTSYVSPIPFGESGFQDGWTCLGCVEQGRRWAMNIADHAFVILFDADLERENPFSPAGLRLYGRIGALQAGHPDAFVEFYSVLQNTNRTDDPPRLPPFYDRSKMDAITYLRQRIREESPTQVIWEFRHPTAWEASLADRLEAVGGDRRDLAEEPLLSRFGTRRPQDVPRPFQIWVSQARLDAAFDAVDSFIHPKTQWDNCLTPRHIGSRSIDNAALTVLGALDEVTAADPNTWAVGSYRFGWFGPHRLMPWEPVAMTASGQAAGGELRILDRFAHESTFVGGKQIGDRSLTEFGSELGRGCAAFAGSRWWATDGPLGTLTSSPRSPFGTPSGRWFGVAALNDTLAVAGADQEIALLRPSTGSVLNRFRARVSPPSPNRLADCSSIALGDGWVATLDPYGARIAVYSLAGDPLADLELSATMPVDVLSPVSIGATGAYLGITQANRLDLIELVNSCGHGGPAPAGVQPTEGAG